MMLDAPRIGRVVALHHGDRFDAAADRGLDAFEQHHVRGLDDRLQARIAEAVDGEAGGRHRQPGAQRRDPRHVVALRAVRLAAAEDDLFDLCGIHPRRLAQRVGDAMGGEIVRPGHVERSDGLGERRPAARNDDGFAHNE